MERKMEEPDFWDVPERSQQHMKTLSDLKEDVATYKKLQDQYEEIELMIEMGYEENDAGHCSGDRGNAAEFPGYF